MSTVNIDATGLRVLAETSIKHGTERAFITIACDWAKNAEKEMGAIHDLILKYVDPLDIAPQDRELVDRLFAEQGD